MTELPSYHHLSPEEIIRLSFRVTLRPLGSTVCEALEGDILTKDIAWQEKVPKEFGPPNGDNQRVCIFTYTDDQFPLRDEACFRGIPSDRDKLRDRMLREDSCKIMLIMAAVNLNSSTESHEIVLCVIKLYPATGLLSSCPAFSETETEDLDDTSVFLNSRSIDEVICKGPRLGTYSFTAKSGYVYTIEWNGARAFGDELEAMIAEQDSIYHEALDERRDRIRKEFDSFDCMYENTDEGTWRNQAHIEIVSVDGFAESNILLCMPLGSNIVVHYRVVKFCGQNTNGDDVLLKGATSNVQSYSVLECLEFVTHFVAAFICIMFAILLSLGDFGDGFIRWVLLSIAPLALMTSSKVFSDITVYHFNHQFAFLYNNECPGKIKHCPPLFLELRAYFKHNFGLTSLAGCGIITLPTEPGNYDVCVPTWKPIACRQMGATRFRLHDFFLGSCLSEINPLDPIPTSCSEGEMVKDDNVRLFSKGGLMTDSCGTIHVLICVSRQIRHHVDSMPRKPHAGMNLTFEESQRNRVRMRETVDEVLARVRRNKRIRRYK